MQGQEPQRLCCKLEWGAGLFFVFSLSFSGLAVTQISCPRPSCQLTEQPHGGLCWGGGTAGAAAGGSRGWPDLSPGHTAGCCQPQVG